MKESTQTLRQWGNSLAVRIPAGIARSARFTVGQPVEVSIVEDHVIVKRIGKPIMTLGERLNRFDPAVHRGEVMADAPVGAEVSDDH